MNERKNIDLKFIKCIKRSSTLFEYPLEEDPEKILFNCLGDTFTFYLGPVLSLKLDYNITIRSDNTLDAEYFYKPIIEINKYDLKIDLTKKKLLSLNDYWFNKIMQTLFLMILREDGIIEIYDELIDKTDPNYQHALTEYKI